MNALQVRSLLLEKKSTEDLSVNYFPKLTADLHCRFS